MAERRMFAKTIVLSDAFLDMPMSARCLYFTLGMLADDDGFVNSPRAIMRQCGAVDDDMKLLISKKFVLLFDTGVIVIKHWRINNYLRNDRHTDTKYREELQSLATDDNGAYTQRLASGIPSDNQLSTTCQADGIPSIGKVSIGEDSIGKDNNISISLSNAHACASEKKENSGIDWRALAAVQLRLGNVNQALHYAECAAEEGDVFTLADLGG